MNSTANHAEGAASRFSLADVLNGVEPSLPESLFGEECRSQMRRVAERLPMRLSSFWGFECRLGEPEPFSDILFEIKKEIPGAAILAGEHPSFLDGLCEEYPAWKMLRAFAQSWTNLDHVWNDDIRNVWLEMDLVGTEAEKVLRQPNIFFGPETKTSKERVFSLIEELMFLFERPAAPALRKFLDDLPRKASVFQIGFMLTRPDDAGMRLCVNKVAPEEILPWIAELCSMNVGEVASLRDILEAVFPLCRDLSLGFNLTKDGVGDAFGIECYEDWLNEDAEQWLPLLDHLTRKGLCLPEKAQGVRDYAGISTLPLRKRVVGDVVYLNTYRKIHHLKLTLSRGALTQAKAYLAVNRPGLPVDLFHSWKTVVSPDADQRDGQAWNVQ